MTTNSGPVRTRRRRTTRVRRWAGGLTAMAVVGYGAAVMWGWARFGHERPGSDEGDRLLDRFMPHYDIVERHSGRVDAPAAIALEAATAIRLEQSTVVDAIIRTRAAFFLAILTAWRASSAVSCSGTMRGTPWARPRA